MILVLDTETTGLPRSYDIFSPLNTATVARLTELAYIFMDTKGFIEKSFNELIIPEGFDPNTLPGSIITGISTEMCKSGVPLKQAIQSLINAIDKYQPTHIVAHNYRFDSFILDMESSRVNLTLNLINHPKQFCTMYKGREFLKLARQPKLDDLYFQIMKKQRKGNHRAFIDARDTARIYKRIQNSNDPTP